MTRWPLRRATRAKAADRALGDKVQRATQRTVDKRAHLVDDIPDWEELRERARALRLEALDRRPELLGQLVRRLEERGAHVTIARSAAEAAARVVALAREAGGAAIKSKSMASEEVGLGAALERAGIEAVETDLGEWIVQQARQGPSHITAPAIHLSVEDIARIFRDRAGVPAPEWVERGEARDEATRQALARELSLTARRILRGKFLGATVGITGANFLVAESGTIVLLENEGNIRLTTCLPRRHVVLAGVEKLIARDDDLAVLLRLLPVSATAQRQSCYVSLLADRHPDLHVVLLDDPGRAALLDDPAQRDLLTCLRCGACLNACPVYRCVGGHAYGGAYPGPIGSLLLPHLGGAARFAELPFACSLCGACAEACPAGIPLTERLVQLRARFVERGLARELGWTLAAATSAMRRGGRMQRAARLYRFGRPFLGVAPVARRWAAQRDFPPPPPETFRAWWARERAGATAAPTTLDPRFPANCPGGVDRGSSVGEAEPSRSEGEPSPPAEGRRSTQTIDRRPCGAGSARRIGGTARAPLPDPHSRLTAHGSQLPTDPLDLFARRFAELGPAGETEFRHVASATAARELLRGLFGDVAPGDVIVEGDEPERREYSFGVTGAAALIADTGGVALDLARRDGAIPSLLVDTHVVVAHPSSVVADLAALFRLRTERRARGDLPGVQVLATGPSRTADIEKTLVIPAHGPRRMVVVVCDEHVTPAEVVTR